MSIFITLNNLPIQNSNYIIFIGNELTWSSTGIIYVDETSIPNSNIFELFPYLFRAKRPKGLIGFEDFCDKIVEMGLSDFIFKKPKVYKQNEPTKETKDEKLNWWFLG